MRRSHSLADVTTLAALTAIYFVSGKLGLMLAFDNVSASAVWPPTGIALAAVLVFGYRVWPAIFLGAFLVNITTAGSVATSLGIATGNMLEALVGAYLVNHFANGRHAFNRAQDVFRLAFLAGMLSTGISATFGATTLALSGLSSWADYGRVWLTWWLGDAVGVLIVAPVALLWYLRPHLHCKRRQFFEAMVLLVAVISLGLIVFGNVLPQHGVDYPIWFFCIPLLVWIAARFGQRETATATFLLSAIAIWGTLRGFGPFVRTSPHESLLLLQTLMGVIAMMAMALSASLFERRRLEAHLVHLADHDPLTDLLSRRGFHAELWRQLAKAKRYGVRGSLLFLDLDDFKRVNDTLGHAAGDQVLGRVAALLRARLRDTDLLARLGGDEFAILLPHTSDGQARAVAEQVLAAIRGQTILVEGRPVAVSASIGIALFPEHGRSVEELLAGADASMYQAKTAGGNRFVVCSPRAGPPRQGQGSVPIRRGRQSLRGRAVAPVWSADPGSTPQSNLPVRAVAALDARGQQRLHSRRDPGGGGALRRDPRDRPLGGESGDRSARPPAGTRACAPALRQPFHEGLVGRRAGADDPARVARRGC